MKKLAMLVSAMIICFFAVAGNAFAFLDVIGYGETGWHTWSATIAADEAGTYRFGFGVANAGNVLNPSTLLIDNINFGPSGNGGFELNNFTGYTRVNFLDTTSISIVSNATSYAGNSYSPTEGNYMARLDAYGVGPMAIAPFGDANVTPTSGSFMYITSNITVLEGDTLSFDWNFLAKDELPNKDFAFFYITPPGSGPITGKLAMITQSVQTASTPEPASLSLLGLGLVGLIFRRRKTK